MSVKVACDLFGNRVDLKRCQECGEVKHQEKFRSTVSSSNGQEYYRVVCWACEKKQQNEKYRNDLRRRKGITLAQVQHRCRENGLEYDLSIDWFLDKIIDGRCEVTGLPFNNEHHEDHIHPLSPQLDRVDPLGDYTKDNVQVVTAVYNCAKGRWTHEDVIEMAEALLNKTDS